MQTFFSKVGTCLHLNYDLTVSIMINDTSSNKRFGEQWETAQNARAMVLNSNRVGRYKNKQGGWSWIGRNSSYLNKTKWYQLKTKLTYMVKKGFSKIFSFLNPYILFFFEEALFLLSNRRHFWRTEKGIDATTFHQNLWSRGKAFLPNLWLVTSQRMTLAFSLFGKLTLRFASFFFNSERQVDTF